MQAGEDKIVYRATIPKTHLMLGGMHIDIDLRRIQFQEEHERRVATVIEHIAIRLLHGMRD